MGCFSDIGPPDSLSLSRVDRTRRKWSVMNFWVAAPLVGGSLSCVAFAVGQGIAPPINDPNPQALLDRESKPVVLLPPIASVASSPMHWEFGGHFEQGPCLLFNKPQQSFEGVPTQVYIGGEGASNAKVPLSETRVCPTSALVRRVLDPVASGLDFLVFGVTHAPQSGRGLDFEAGSEAKPLETEFPVPADTDSEYSIWGQSLQGPRRQEGEDRTNTIAPGQSAMGEAGLVPAVRTPPIVPSLPGGEFLDFDNRVPEGTEAQGRDEWRPPTNPFEDDPLQVQDDGLGRRGNDLGSQSKSHRLKSNLLDDHSIRSVVERRGGVPTRAREEMNASLADASINNGPMLDGYCAVSMIEQGEWVVGRREFGVIHLGEVYYFASRSAQEKFQRFPQRFSPVLNGIDIVLLVDQRKIVKGHQAFGWIDREYGHVFLFSSEESASRFSENSQYYAMHALAITNRVLADCGR